MLPAAKTLILSQKDFHVYTKMFINIIYVMIKEYTTFYACDNYGGRGDGGRGDCGTMERIDERAKTIEKYKTLNKSIY